MQHKMSGKQKFGKLFTDETHSDKGGYVVCKVK